METSTKMLYFKCGRVIQLTELPEGTQPKIGNEYYLDKVCPRCQEQGHHEYVFNDEAVKRAERNLPRNWRD